MAAEPSTHDVEEPVEESHPEVSPGSDEGTEAPVEDATGGQEPYSPPESSAGSVEPPEPETLEIPTFVISCPNCSSTFPWTAELEGFEPSKSPHFHTCAECDGMGIVLTGSHVLAHSTKECPNCHGLGYETDDPALITTFPPNDPPWVGAVWHPETQSWEVA